MLDFSITFSDLSKRSFFIVLVVRAWKMHCVHVAKESKLEKF